MLKGDSKARQDDGARHEKKEEERLHPVALPRRLGVAPAGDEYAFELGEPRGRSHADAQELVATQGGRPTLQPLSKNTWAGVGQE